jgi:short-subunit dehydrogenase
MSVRLKPLSNQVIVITGASSGIGLATAKAAAERGAKVVLAARNAAALAEVAGAIRASGGEAVDVAADVGDRGSVQRIADTAIQRFGGFDSWVNNAGVGIFGRMSEVSDEDHHRLFQTNFWGLVYGSFIAAEHLRDRGGALINMGSVAADIGLPLQGMYAASKHAIKGFTDAFRMELEAEGAPISVTLIKPTSINTPFSRNAKNYTDRAQQLPPPTYAPEEVARAILHAAENGGRDYYVGGAGKILSSVNKHAPRVMDVLGERMMSQQFRDEPPRSPEGTLYQPGTDGEVWGDQPGYTRRRSFYARASMHPVLSGALLAAAGLAAAGAIIGGGGRGRS